MYGYPQPTRRSQHNHYNQDRTYGPRPQQKYPNAYQHRCGQDHHRGYPRSRDWPNDIEEATRAHVKAVKEYDDARVKYQEYMWKYEEARRKLDEATTRLSVAKRREAGW